MDYHVLLIFGLMSFGTLVECTGATEDPLIPREGLGHCTIDKLVVYKIVVRTFWTANNFPKDHDPGARFSRVVGRTHGDKFSMFHLGGKVSEGFKMFANTGDEHLLTADGEGVADILDQFSAAPIQTGAGVTEAVFMADGDHSKVSIASKIIPSPDWFIGLDSFELCVNGNWIDTATIEADPLDAGTQSGFTFQSPDIPTIPQSVVTRITRKFPSNQASSFSYPYLLRLPPIATFQLIKMRAYDLSDVFEHGQDEKKYDVIKVDNRQKDALHDIFNEENDVEEDITLWREQGIKYSQHDKSKMTENPQHVNFISSDAPTSATTISIIETTPTTTSAATNSTSHHKGKRHGKKRKNKYVRKCEVSEWSEWSGCVGCSMGTHYRQRKVTVHPVRDKCPSLTQSRMCLATPKTCERETQLISTYGYEKAMEMAQYYPATKYEMMGLPAV